jgi:hypothetical protein
MFWPSDKNSSDHQGITKSWMKIFLFLQDTVLDSMLVFGETRKESTVCWPLQ